jgi:soluble lytic murein transglycosylase
MGFKHIGIVLAALLAGGLAASGRVHGPASHSVARPDANAPIARTGNIHILSAADHDIFTRAFAAAAKSDWVSAIALGDQGQDAIARQLLQWRYALDENSGARFADVDAALKMAAGWPLRNTLYTRAEADIPLEMTSAQIVQWFAQRTPVSAIGQVRLGEALVANGDTARGAMLIRQGWSNGSFDDATEARIQERDTAYLTPESDRARLDALLWRNEISAAQRQMTRVDAQTAALAKARIALAGGLAHARAALAKVSDSTDPTLLYDWARALRAEHKDAAAHAMLLRVEPTALARDHGQRWWSEVTVEARDALAAGDPRLALMLVDHAQLPVGEQYPDQQFLAGFISLRVLKDAARALPYFQRQSANVSRPISKSRAEYWQGRAYEALGDTANAYTHYRLAAAYPDTFYGQLAVARTENAPVLRLNDTLGPPAPKSEIESDALMPQIKVLAELGQEDDLRFFAEREAQTNRSPAHLKEFLQSLSEWGYREIAVRVAKAAGYAGLPMLSFAYPTLDLPAYPVSGPGPQPSLVHALIRQETEFDPQAISSAGARGLMQVMLSAAKTSARAGGLPYRPGALVTDTTYNIQLGMIEFERHYNSWDGSLLLATAAYNAGPGNVRKWIAANGDPANGVDPIDWIELIPFGETRNYVERVLENMEIYKNRLAGRDMPLTIMTDLYAPATLPGWPVLGAPAAAPVRAKVN